MEHQEADLRSFFHHFTGGAIVGIEAGGYSAWFVELVEWISHKVLIGNAAGLILDPLLWASSRKVGETGGAMAFTLPA